MKVKFFLKFLRDYFSGEFAYQKYLEHAQKHPKSSEGIISKNDFLRKKNCDKWNKINRCC